MPMPNIFDNRIYLVDGPSTPRDQGKTRPQKLKASHQRQLLTKAILKRLARHL